ncbi:MAG: alpha amylase C-terminal domain-containing protein, partial [Alphaproteobacteria bacterium]|nr:alpha amylase C-terminal domain-containing protein [Alphaproteobacteria bacterium]
HANAADSVISYMRKGKNPGDYLIVVCNFTPVVRKNYRIGVPENCFYQEIFNSDDINYWGSGVKNDGARQAQPQGWNERPFSIEVTLPPLSTIVIKPQR